METHPETTHKRHAPRVSPLGLVTALAVFIIALFAFGDVGLREDAPSPATHSMSVKRPSAIVLNDGKKIEEDQAVLLLKKSIRQKKEIKDRRAAERPERTKPSEAHRAEVAKSARQKPRAAKPAAEPAVERYAVIPLNTRRTTPPVPGSSRKVPSAVKLPISGQKIPDTYVKVDAPPPATGKETAPEWYTVKLKPVPSKNLADATASGLRQRGFVESQAVAGPNGTYYVKIGGYGFRNAAEDAKKQLGALGFTDAHIDEKTVAK